MQPAIKLVAFVAAGRARIIIIVAILSLLLLSSSCGSNRPDWNGSFTGKVEEKLEERPNLSPHKTTKDFAVKQNFTVTAASESERDKAVTFGDCKLRFHSDLNPPGDRFQTSPGQLCKINFGGYNGDFEMNGYASIRKDKNSGNDVVILTISGDSIETIPYTKTPKMYYGYNFSGERK